MVVVCVLCVSFGTAQHSSIGICSWFLLFMVVLVSIHSGLGVHTRTVVWVSTREQWFACPHENSGLGVNTKTLGV